MVRFRGRDITSFRPADVHLGACFKYTVDKTPYGGFAKHTKRVAHNVTPRRQLGLSPWRDVMCDTLCMLGEAAVRGLIDCIYRKNYCQFFLSFIGKYLSLFSYGSSQAKAMGV